MFNAASNGENGCVMLCYDSCDNLPKSLTVYLIVRQTPDGSSK